MTQQVLETIYDPRAVEPAVFDEWVKSGAFRSQPADPPTPHERTFTIVMPPPNVTGALHLGHALNNTLQDILTRYHRMRGFNTLWQPGTDHAGIATQAVVERRIREQEGKSRHDLGREELVRRIWQWKDEYEKRIIDQLKLMGCSADWERCRFTLDEGLARAVRHQFFNLFKDGLIFRGKRLVNWDTELQTAVANDEVYYETIKGHFWHFKYPVIDPQPGEPEFVVIATTRPETMLGDTAVAVNPDPDAAMDRLERELTASLASAPAKERGEWEKKLEALRARRETHLPGLRKLAEMARAGRKVRLPLVEREIPLIADEWADPTLGSGCVKITPAHDPNDYEVGLRHGLPMINVLTADGKVAPIIEPDATCAPVESSGSNVNQFSSRYAGLAFSTAGRERVVADMESRGLIEGIEERDREVAHSDRSKVEIQPFWSDQWFLRTEGAEGHGKDIAKSGLAQAAIDVVQSSRMKVFPERYTKTYLDWLGEKRDWCISRQLWWGHRIPVWTYDLSTQGKVSLLRGGAEMPDADRVALAAFQDIPKRYPDDVIGSTPEQELIHQSTPNQLLEHGKITPPTIVQRMTLQLCVRTEKTQIIHEVENAGFLRDDDVLDTWFSSALWPFSTLGWPEDTPHLRQYYPGSVLITSRDIITNWVARMVMFGLYSLGEVPFDHVYVHPKILDGRGETMSKSKGNGVDPVDIIHTHGADALRYTMADMCTETQDIRMPVDYVCPHCGKLTDQSAALKTEEQHRKSRGQKLERKLQPADCSRVRCIHKECGQEFATQWAGADLKKELPAARETSEKFEIGRNFCNKLWNAARFAFMNLGDPSRARKEADPCGTDLQSVNTQRLETGATAPASARADVQSTSANGLQSSGQRISAQAEACGSLMPEDRWILAQLSQTIREYHRLIQTYQFSASVKVLREFFWDSLCDWYIELTKPRMTGSDPAVRQILAFCLDQTLRLFHPVIPFITERLWAQLNAVAPRRGIPGVVELDTDKQLVVSEFPPTEGYPALDADDLRTAFADLQDATRGVRDLRARCGVPPKQRVTVTVVAPESAIAAFNAHKHIVQHMAGIEALTVVPRAKRPANAGSIAVRHLRIYVHDISDDAAERERSEKSLAALEKQIAAREGKLNNPGFVAKADAEFVLSEREKLDEQLVQRAALREHLAELTQE